MVDKQNIVQRCERAEMEAWADMIAAAPASFKADFGMEAHHFDMTTALLCSKIPTLLFNRVIGIGLWQAASEAQLDEIIGYYRAAGVGQFTFQVCQSAASVSLANWLEARGFVGADHWIKVYRTRMLAPQIVTDFRIVEAAPRQADVFARTLCAGDGLPDFLIPFASGIVGRSGWHCYLAYDGDQPVATGALYVNRGVGWLGAAATLPSHRKHGGQGALMARRIQDGIALGCEWFVTETDAERPDRPNPSFHNMLRTGFQEAHLRANYLSPALN